MRKGWFIICGLAVWLLLAGPVGAQSGDSPLSLAVIDGEGAPVNVAALGCAYSDGPGYAFEQYGGLGCTSCSVYTCTFEIDRPGMGGYVQSSQFGYTSTVPGGTWQIVQGNQTGVLWGDAPWTSTRYITFHLTLATPTPIPTLTPFPTPTPPIASGTTITELSSGFNVVTFTQYYGVLSSEGIVPDFGLDHEQWLFAGRKWIQFLNQGNLLYVMGGVLLASLVLKWAIDRIKNPR